MTSVVTDIVEIHCKILTQSPLPLFFPEKFSESRFEAENHSNSAVFYPFLCYATSIERV